MLDIPPGPATILLGAGCIYVLAHIFGETKKLRHIPTIGYNDPLLSYWSAIQFQLDPPKFLRARWPKIDPSAKFAKIPGLLRWIVVPVLPEQYQDITRAPEALISFDKAVEEHLFTDFTLHNQEIGDNTQIPAIRINLTRSLDVLTPRLHEEAEAAFEDSFPLEGDDWKSFVVSPEILKIVGRVSGRALVGLPLCRNSEYVKANVAFATDVMVVAYGLTIVPPPLRAFFVRLFSPVPARIKQVSSFILPVVNKRREEMLSQGAGYEKPLDFLTWLMEVAQEKNRSDRDIVLRMMSTNFGSIHSTSLTLTHAIYTLLIYPQYIEPLRREIEECLENDGWSKDAVDNMQLLDGFMKESQRVDVIGYINGIRLSVQDCTLAGTFIPKGTLLAANVINGHFDKSVWGDDAMEFDPYRFVKIEEKTGRKIAIPTTSYNLLTFGHGKHSCPGRHFAAQELKLMMAHFLMQYDAKLDNKDGARPGNIWIGINNMPNPSARILLRRRVKGSQ